MCRECWEDFGSPSNITPETIEAANAIAEVCKHREDGGNLRTLISDWNIDDFWIGVSSARIDRNEDAHSPEQIVAERRCLDLFKSLSEEARHVAMAIHSGFLKEES